MVTVLVHPNYTSIFMFRLKLDVGGVKAMPHLLFMVMMAESEAVYMNWESGAEPYRGSNAGDLILLHFEGLF